MASTFDPELVHQVGELLAEEAKVKSSVILLAPTCNIQRNPLGGRAFESFSEDPHLSGMTPYPRRSEDTRLNSSHSGESRMPSSA